MRIDSVPISPPRKVSPTDSVYQAAVMMREYGVGSLAVVDGERLAGMLTDRDVALAVLCDRIDPQATTVGEILHGPPVSMLPTATVADAAHRMRRARVRRLPVVSPKGRLFGIVAHDDLLARLALRLHRVGQAVSRQLTSDEDQT